MVRSQIMAIDPIVLRLSEFNVHNILKQFTVVPNRRMRLKTEKEIKLVRFPYIDNPNAITP
jgi:hypothetical protein